MFVYQCCLSLQQYLNNPIVTQSVNYDISKYLTHEKIFFKFNLLADLIIFNSIYVIVKKQCG